MTSVFRISLDIHQTQSQVSIPATQGADNVRLIIRLTEKGNPFDIEDGSYAIFSAVKPDGNPLYNDCAIYRNSTIVYDFTPQTTAVEGITKCQIHLYDTYGRKLHSPRFQIVVHPDIYGNEIESTMEYKALAAFVGIKDDIKQDISDNADAIAALKEKITTAGTITIPASEWTDTLPKLASPEQPVLVKGTVALLMPSNTASQIAARKAKITVQAEPYKSGNIIVQREDGEAPTENITLDYIIIKVDNPEAPPKAALIGVDAYGEGGGGTGSGVDEDAVKKIINSLLGNVANVRQYSADNPPPYPVTSINGKKGAVTLSVPSKASDINAEEAGAVSTHNADKTAHPYLSGRVATALDRISGLDTNIEEINTSVAERLKTADLAAKLDAYKAAQGLVSNTTRNLTNYYLKSEIYTKEEVAALISAIPKFEIKVVSSLPTANISLTTVYLVKDTTEGGGLYTEYIYVNGTWEELGNQSLDLSGYVTDEELDNLLKSYATLTKVSELIADALKPYATDEEVAEAIRVATVNFVTGSQVTTAINEALKSYYTSAQVDAQIAAQIKTALDPYITKDDADKVYQPAGDYLTPSDIPDKLPNPKPLTINGKTYDGSDAVSVTVDGSGEETPSIVLPSKLYAVAGHEFVLYYKNILRAMRPDDFVVSAKISNSAITNLRPLYENYIRFTPTESLVGQHTITIIVKSRRNWATVAEKSVTLVVSADRTFAGKKVVFIGDSLTDDPTYINALRDMSSGGIVSVGTLDGAEGRSGAASYDYVNKSVICRKYANPFYNPNTEYSLTLDALYNGAEPNLLTLDNSGSVSVLKHRFDFSYYMENNRATIGEPDAVFLNLGTNGGNMTSYKAVYIAFDAMVERIRAYSADLPIFIHLFPPKSEAGSIERNFSGQFSGLFNERTWYYDIIQTYIDRYDNDPRVTVVPTYTMLDTVYDFKRETVAVSARNPIEVTMGQNDGVHPATPGYLHMADSYYNIMLAYWSGEPIDTYYTVTNHLDHVTNSNTTTSVKAGNSYTATITAASGYTLDTVTVTMGGEPVSVSGGKINIVSVTGDIVITATAIKDEEPEEPTVVNLVDPSTANDASPNTALDADEWVNGYTITGSNTTLAITQADGRFVSDKFPISDNAKVRIKGMDMRSSKRASNKMLIIMSDGRIFKSKAMPIGEPGTASVDQSLVDSEGIMLVTISAFEQAASWPGKAYARICGYPKDGDNYNVVVTVE